ncbi:MAG: hypothetical protein DMG06_24955 [Acidobacteria bacterium]|nr:MAG: hypothetical protein DMG06_24955 [Acidobacteriota bacterium]
MKGLRELADLCKQQILDRQLPGGGWGFGKNNQWATEPTCLALLALRLEPSTVYGQGLTFLLRCQNSNGSWPAFADDDQEGSWVTALVVITLIRLTGDWKAVDCGVSWLLSRQGQESHWLMKWRYRTHRPKSAVQPRQVRLALDSRNQQLGGANSLQFDGPEEPFHMLHDGSGGCAAQKGSRDAV